MSMKNCQQAALAVAASIGLLMNINLSSAATSTAETFYEKEKTKDLIVEGRVTEISSKCSAISCTARKVRVESSRIFFRRDQFAKDVDLSVVTVCGALDLSLGKTYVFFLKNEASAKLPSAPLTGQDVGLGDARVRCDYQYGVDDIFFVNEGGDFYQLLGFGENYVSADRSLVVGGRREYLLGPFLKHLDSR